MNNYYFYYAKGYDYSDGIDLFALKEVAKDLGVEIQVLQNGNIQFYGTKEAVEQVKKILGGEISLEAATSNASLELQEDDDLSSDGNKALDNTEPHAGEEILAANNVDIQGIVEEVLSQFELVEDELNILPEQNKSQSGPDSVETPQEQPQDTTNAERPLGNTKPSSDAEIDTEFRLIDKPTVEWDGAIQEDVVSSKGAIQDVMVGEHETLATPESDTNTYVPVEDEAPLLPNVDPIANNDSFAVTENGAPSQLWSHVLMNDEDNESLIISSVGTGTTNGTVVLDTDGSSLLYSTGSAFDYLAVGQTATDTFTYTVDDGRGGNDTATVTITVTGVNDGPVAVADSFTVAEGASNSTLHATFLANDADIDTTDVLDIISVDTTGLTGSLTFDNATNALSYTASGFDSLAVGETATDTFTYTISDGNGGTDTETVTVTITGVNDAPVANNDDVTTDEDTNLTGNVFADNGNGVDYDVDSSDTITLVNPDGGGGPFVYEGSSGGVFVFQANGDFTFTPGDDFQDLDIGESRTTSVTYMISDDHGVTDTATMTVTVTGMNDAPVATVDLNQGELDEGGNSITIDESVLLNNDTDIEGDVLDVTAMSVDPIHGTIVDNGDGTWTYTSANDSLPFLGNATITYTVTDDGGLSDTGTFNLRVFNILTGTAGDDVITPENDFTPHKFIDLDGNDHVTGSTVRDIFVVGNGDNTLLGLAGSDDFVFSGALTGENIIDGGDGTDKLLGSDGDDSFYIASITNVEQINTGDGNDTFYGSTGDDTYMFAGVYIAGLETLDGNGGTDIIIGDSSANTIDLSSITTITGIHHIDGLGGDDTIRGSQSADHIYASVGIDALYGNGGDDTFYVFGTENFTNPDGYFGGDGYDKIVGTDGDDDIAIDGTSFRGFSSIEEIDGGLGTNRILGDDYGSKQDDVLDFSNTLLVNIDYIDGRGGDDTIRGSQGNDTILLSAGADTMYGNGGNDTFLFSGVMDVKDSVFGGDGTDSIIGSDGDDTLRLTAMSDIELIDGGLGVNTLQVGTGNTIDLSGFTSGVDLLNFSYLTDNSRDETLYASQGDDTIRISADSYADRFYGNAGNDTFLIDGTQNGDDVYDGGDGYDSLIGGDNDDFIRVVTFVNFEHIDLGLGTNVILVDQNDTVDFSSFAAGDFLNVTEIRDESGGSTITASQGNDTIRMTADTGNDVFNGDLGDDTFLINGSYTGNDRIDGGDGFDSLIGSDNDDFFSFEVLTSIEFIDLGAGANTLRVDYHDTMDFSGYDGTNFLNVTYLMDDGGLETITGSQLDDTFILTVDQYADVLNGGLGDDTFIVSGRHIAGDVIDGGAGTNRIIGGDGDDTFRFTNVTNIASIDLGLGTNIIYGSANNAFDLTSYTSDQLLNVQISDTTGTEVVTGAIGDNVFRLNSDAHNDTFNGGDGNDTFIIDGHNTANDFILGGNGTDQIIGTDGDDSFKFTNVSGIETIDLGAGTNTIYGDVGSTLDLSGYAAGTVVNAWLSDNTGVETVIGTQGDDTFSITVDNGIDTFNGGEGNDTFIISGNNTVNEFILGGNGTDQIIGTDGNDSFKFTNVSGIETIDLGAGTNTIYGDAGAILDLSDYAAGAVTNVRISDTSGTETIFGTQGDDVLYSVGDNLEDTYYGEAGADTFLFVELTSQSDVIADFDAGEGDALDISNILSNYDPVTDAISDFVALTSNPGMGGLPTVTLSIDIDGADNGVNFVDLVVFTDQNQTLEDMITSGSIII